MFLVDIFIMGEYIVLFECIYMYDVGGLMFRKEWEVCFVVGLFDDIILFGCDIIIC